MLQTNLVVEVHQTKVNVVPLNWRFIKIVSRICTKSKNQIVDQLEFRVASVTSSSQRGHYHQRREADGEARGGKSAGFVGNSIAIVFANLYYFHFSLRYYLHRVRLA